MKKKLLALAALAVATAARAELDESVIGGIEGAAGHLFLLYGALTAAGVVIWVGTLIHRKFRVR